MHQQPCTSISSMRWGGSNLTSVLCMFTPCSKPRASPRIVPLTLLFCTALHHTVLQMQQQYKTDEGGVVTEPYIAAIVSPYDRWATGCSMKPSSSLAVPALHAFGHTCDRTLTTVHNHIHDQCACTGQNLQLELSA